MLSAPAPGSTCTHKSYAGRSRFCIFTTLVPCTCPGALTSHHTSSDASAQPSAIAARRGEAHGAARPPSAASHFGAQLSQEVAHRVLDRSPVLDEELGVELGVGEAHLGEVTQPGLVLRREARRRWARRRWARRRWARRRLARRRWAQRWEAAGAGDFLRTLQCKAGGLEKH